MMQEDEMSTTVAQPVSTFSIVAFDEDTADLGVAVQSKFLAVGAAVPWARAGVGAIATQAWANLSYGPTGLDLLGQGLSATEALAHLVEADERRSRRQVGIVDAQGRGAAYTGRECTHWAGHVVGEGYTCQGNILVDGRTVQAMVQGFEAAEGELAERLVAALLAGQEAGGDRRGRQSAALLVVREGGSYGGFIDRYIDLRVDDHPTPIQELRRLLRLQRLYFGRSQEARLLPLEEELTREVQVLLGHLDFYRGPDHGRYDEATRRALADWAGIENLEERLLAEACIDPVVLEFLREKGREASR
jgi:uncharacterized Ntn-hydrolase superfamily protein